MNISSMEVTERKIDSSKINICTAKKELSSGGVLWVTTSEGNIFLLNENLEDVANFPIMISGIPSGDSSSFDEGLIIPLEKKLCYVSLDGKEKIIDLCRLKEAWGWITWFEGIQEKGGCWQD